MSDPGLHEAVRHDGHSTLKMKRNEHHYDDQIRAFMTLSVTMASVLWKWKEMYIITMIRSRPSRRCLSRWHQYSENEKKFTSLRLVCLNGQILSDNWTTLLDNWNNFVEKRKPQPAESSSCLATRWFKLSDQGAARLKLGRGIIDQDIGSWKVYSKHWWNSVLIRCLCL